MELIQALVNRKKTVSGFSNMTALLTACWRDQ
jgi:hypothetical protein